MSVHGLTFSSLSSSSAGDMITEEALPTYMAMLNTLDGVRDETGASPTPWATWTRLWTAEENRHGDLMSKYIYLTGRCVGTWLGQQGRWSFCGWGSLGGVGSKKTVTLSPAGRQRLVGSGEGLLGCGASAAARGVGWEQKVLMSEAGSAACS